MLLAHKCEFAHRCCNLQSLLTQIKSTVTQLHSHTLALFTANRKITLQRVMPGYPIPYSTKIFDHQLPWDFTANLKVSRPEVFQTKETRKKILIAKWRTFIQEVFPQASIFYRKDNLNIAGFSCNQKAKAGKDSSWRADFCYLRVLRINPKILSLFRNE